MPRLFVITGSNGAGKSTTANTYLPQHIESIFDGDKLYMQQRSLLWQQGIRVDKEIKKIASDFVDSQFESLVAEALANRQDFAYEGHFSEEASWKTPERFKASGYSVFFYFLGLTQPELSADRVLIRVKEGGHHVDMITLRDNFYGNMQKLDEHLDMLDFLEVIDSSLSEHKVLIIIESGKVLETVPFEEMPFWLTSHMPNLLKLIIDNENHR